MDNLKPCPFCGKPVNIYYSSATKGYYVVHIDEQHSDCMVLMPLSINHNRLLLSLAEAYAMSRELKDMLFMIGRGRVEENKPKRGRPRKYERRILQNVCEG